MYSQNFSGGYLPEAGAENNDGILDKGSRGRLSVNKSKNKTSVVPLTIKTVLEIASQPGENLQIDGQPVVVQVVVLGRVLNIEEHPTKSVFTIDDTTGQLEFVFYKKSDEIPAMLTKLSCKTNMYLNVIIAIRPFRDGRIFVATGLEEVKDYNQITYFLLNCFVTHAQRVYGYVEPQEEKDAEINYQKSRSFENQTPSKTTLPQTGKQNPTDSVSKSTANYRLIHNAIKKIITDSTSSNASASFDQILGKFPGKFDAKTLRQYLTELINKGEIYTMDDDDHFRAI